MAWSILLYIFRIVRRVKVSMRASGWSRCESTCTRNRAKVNAKEWARVYICIGFRYKLALYIYICMYVSIFPKLITAVLADMSRKTTTYHFEKSTRQAVQLTKFLA